MRKRLVAGNWKMNNTLPEALSLVTAIREAAVGLNETEVEVVVIPPFPFLKVCKDHLNNLVKIGAQNVAAHESGAFTVEVAANMLDSMGVDYVLIGHSERRSYYQETAEVLQQKVNCALNSSMSIIFCCGESLADRESDKHFEIVENQLANVIFKLSESEFKRVIIAYEPVWAIGTGKTASTEQAQEMHKYIRSLIDNKYGNDIAVSTLLLYGGSCKPDNASALFAEPDIDGGLIGGASLNADDFMNIVKA